MCTRNAQNLPHGDILIVDDNTANLKSMTDILTVTGYNVEAVSDGESAILSVQKNQPELILLDYKMSNMNGIEVCRRIKTNPDTEAIPIIFLSAHGETGLKVQAMEAGAIDYVIKPIQPAEVLIKIDSHLKIYRLQQRLANQSKELQSEIEERKLIEQKLTQSLEREQALANSVREAPLAIAFGYSNGNLRNCNKKFSELTGYSLEELQKNDWNETLTPKKWKKSEIEKLGQLSFSNNSVHYEKEYIHKNGTHIPIELIVTAQYDSFHNVQYYVSFIIDITEKKEIESQLFQNEKLATIARLSAGVSHELNTPLSAILQAHQLVQAGLSPENAVSRAKAAENNVDLSKVEEYFIHNELDYFFDGIREAALNASQIVKSLMEFSRPHEGLFSQVTLKEIAENALLLAQADYDMKKKYNIANIQLIHKYEPNLPPVNCVATEIEQVLLNLITNSAQSFSGEAGKTKPRIIIRTTANKTYAVIDVEDNGPGIPEDVIEHIFDPFFSTREVGTGTGLGLSVAHAIIADKHRGNIRVKSAPGQGTKVTVELPLR